MVSIVWSVLSIALIIGVGWVARRGGALGPEAAGTLASATYWVASPAMLFHAIVSTGTSGVFGVPLAVAAASGVGTALLFALVGRFFLRLTRGEIALGAMASSLNNGAYIGIPIAVYVLNDASAVVPILVFQLGFFTPMFFVLADLVGSGQRPSIVGIARVVARNPMVIAAVCGFLFSAVGWPMPTLLDVSTSMLGAAAPPMILLSFGASLVDRRSASGDSGIAATACAIVGKLALQPAIACGVGMLLGLTGPALMSVTIMAALPSAQNAYIAATRAKAGERIAQGTVLVTTFASLPVVVGIAALFHALGLVGATADGKRCTRSEHVQFSPMGCTSRSATSNSADTRQGQRSPRQ